jgi:hypothetical protein
MRPIGCRDEVPPRSNKKWWKLFQEYLEVGDTFTGFGADRNHYHDCLRRRDERGSGCLKCVAIVKDGMRGPVTKWNDVIR